MRTTGFTNDGSFENVRRVHSSAIAAGDAAGSQASRPNAYQFAWLKCDPVQFRSVPVLATPAMPVRREPKSEPSPTRATAEPLPFTHVSADSASENRVPRYARCVSSPRYSFVIWNSIMSGVFGIAPKSGENGSRGWKSSGPFLTWINTVLSEPPSSGGDLSVA